MCSESLPQYMFIYYGEAPDRPRILQLKCALRASVSVSDEKATEVFLKCLSQQCHSKTKLSACWDFIDYLKIDFSPMSSKMSTLLNEYQEMIGQRLRNELHQSHMSLIGITYLHK